MIYTKHDTNSHPGDAVYPWDTEDPQDVEAAERKLEFSISWFADPIYHGKYPDSMRKQLGDRLPTFTDEEIALVKGSNDFYGMNHYTANYIKHKTTPAEENDFLGNLETLFENKKGENIGPETQSVWLRPNPQGFHDLILWISKRYGFPPSKFIFFSPPSPSSLSILLPPTQLTLPSLRNRKRHLPPPRKRHSLPRHLKRHLPRRLFPQLYSCDGICSRRRRQCPRVSRMEFDG